MINRIGFFILIKIFSNWLCDNLQRTNIMVTQNATNNTLITWWPNGIIKIDICLNGKYFFQYCLFFHEVATDSQHDDVIKWKHFPSYWPFVRGIHRSPVNSPHKGQWRGALMFSLIWAWINGWVNNREAGDLSRHRTHYDRNELFVSQQCCHTARCSE